MLNPNYYDRIVSANRTKWDRIYSNRDNPGSPSEVLSENLSILPSKGLALDLACGLGANSLFLESKGLSVHAWDISIIAIEKLKRKIDSNKLNITAQCLDIKAEALPTNEYDLIIISNYLDRSLTSAIFNALRAEGLVCYQTFTAEKRVKLGPSNPDYLLRPNEIKSFVKGCQILAFKDQSLSTDVNHPLSGKSYIIGQKPATNDKDQ